MKGVVKMENLDVDSYKIKLFNLLMDGKDWDRKHTTKTYDYLHGAFYCKEINISECETSTILLGITNLCELLFGEGMYESKGDQCEMRSTILAVMDNLHIITKDQKKKITDKLYKFD